MLTTCVNPKNTLLRGQTPKAKCHRIPFVVPSPTETESEIMVVEVKEETMGEGDW